MKPTVVRELKKTKPSPQYGGTGSGLGSYMKRHPWRVMKGVFGKEEIRCVLATENRLLGICPHGYIMIKSPRRACWEIQRHIKPNL
jgi:hypothetical protein